MKRVLSTQHQARVEIESLIDGEDFSETLTRARFEEVRDASKMKPKHVYIFTRMARFWGISDAIFNQVARQRRVDVQVLSIFWHG